MPDFLMCNCSEIASLLLAHENWETMMKQKMQCDSDHPELVTPLTNLIVKMPGKCYIHYGDS